MVADCAKMAVELKVNRCQGEPAMISDYECAYACSWALKRLGIQADPETELDQLKDDVMSQEQKLSQGDETDRSLLALIKPYKVQGTHGEGISELIRMGMEA